jgi:hypothetical protein
MVIASGSLPHQSIQSTKVIEEANFNESVNDYCAPVLHRSIFLRLTAAS